MADHESGLDPDELAEVAAATASPRPGSGQGSPQPNKRAIWVLLLFVVAYVPLVLLGTWLATNFVYEPLCSAEGLAVESVDQSSWSLTTGGQEATCNYDDGTSVTLPDKIGSWQSFAVNLGVTLFRFGLPFFVIGMVIWLLPNRT